MNARPTLERRLTDWLQADAPARAPERVLDGALDRVAVVGQERTITIWRNPDRSRTSRVALIAAMVAGSRSNVGGWSGTRTGIPPAARMSSS